MELVIVEGILIFLLFFLALIFVWSKISISAKKVRDIEALFNRVENRARKVHSRMPPPAPREVL